MRIHLLVVAATVFVVGCGSSASQDKPEGGTVDSGARRADTGAPVDSGARPPKDSGAADTGPNHGSVSTTYPAFPPFMPKVVNNGAPSLSSPSIVTVSWPGVDPNSATWEAFDDAIGSSEYWSMITPEYGVGAASGGGHVEITDPFALMSDADVSSFVATNAASGWPAPVAGTLYTLYLPPGASVSLQGVGDACANGIGGYHDAVTVGAGPVAYAVILQCSGGGGVDQTTTGASHELLEAATDPQPHSGYAGVDDSLYFAWDDFQELQDEVADMCELYPDSVFIDNRDTALNHGVQRIWSNKAAAAGNAPCVPNVESGPYFNVTPLEQETVTVDTSALGGPAKLSTRGYGVPVGASRTFAVGFYSSGPTSGAWDIAVHAGNPLTGQTADLTASVDVASGQNGTLSYVTVHVNGTDATGTKSNLVTIESKVPGDQDCGGFGCQSRWMPILISSDE